MSRCLPFSPEAFANRHSNFIKLQKENEELKAERRRVKELKKKARHESKHKDKSKDKDKKRQHKHKYVASDGKVIKPNDKKYSQETMNEAELSARYPSKSVVDEAEQPERSDVTVEHNLPTCAGRISIVPGSIDSTNKRKRQEGSVNGTEDPKNILRIRLPLKKHSEPNTSLIQQDKNRLPEVSVTRPQEIIEQRNCHANQQTNMELERPSTKPCADLPGQTKTSNAKIIRACVDKPKHGTKSMYKMLIEDWVPPNCHGFELNNFVDEDWLFGSRNQQQLGESKRHKADHGDVSCSRSTNLWPQAKLFTGADVYALPYTVPF